ncbi:GT4 family glycosyltransferase PelF [Novosphingobium bradum]|uniref:GT4 family glycosyltransferase PelF n=1 Tax=Novosphingobium bradum TaxID=1737444 RepID=A0ABV7ISQ7_9SPHN
MKPGPGGTSDVCMIVEGAYPYVTGGVASWLQELMTSLPELSFSIVAIKANERPQPWQVSPPANVVEIIEVPLSRSHTRRYPFDPAVVDRIGRLLLTFLMDGDLADLGALTQAIARLPSGSEAHQIVAAPEIFALLTQYYEVHLGTASFHHFFWAMQILLGGLLAVLAAPLPRARVYHTLSTGYSGLMAARARLETARPALLTEHGIYLLERQIEIMMVDWLGDQIETGLGLERDCFDLTDLWGRAFESYGRACYDACDPIVSLYGANSQVQKRLGADDARLRIIPNGIRLERFAGIVPQPSPRPLLVALIGRVVPIKDIKTFIRAAALARLQVPEARFVVLGPEDEDPDYSGECRALVDELDLVEAFTFAGRVNVAEWLGRIDLVVLTSLSEAQPLVILEAGACGIPAIAPDVGSCRELLEGSSGSAGGVITALVDPEATANAMVRLLRDPELRHSMGEAMRERVRRDYDWSGIVAQYRDLYHDLSAS